MKRFVYLKNVVTLELDTGKCNGCGMCVKVCPHEVFELHGGKAHIIDHDYCMECGACALNCAPGVITVRAGVGCAAAIILGALKNQQPTCGCSSEKTSCS